LSLALVSYGIDMNSCGTEAGDAPWMIIAVMKVDPPMMTPRALLTALGQFGLLDLVLTVTVDDRPEHLQGHLFALPVGIAGPPYCVAYIHPSKISHTHTKLSVPVREIIVLREQLVVELHADQLLPCGTTVDWLRLCCVHK